MRIHVHLACCVVIAVSKVAVEPVAVVPVVDVVAVVHYTCT